MLFFKNRLSEYTQYSDYQRGHFIETEYYFVIPCLCNLNTGLRDNFNRRFG